MAFYGSPEALPADVAGTELDYPHTPRLVDNVVAVLTSRQAPAVVYTPEAKKLMDEIGMPEDQRADWLSAF